MKSKEQFEFKVAGEYEKPAIWFKLRKKQVLIFPIALYESLWDCYNTRRIGKGIKASFQIFPKEVYGYYYDDSCGTYSIEYDRYDYVNSAIRALIELCKYVIGGNETVYNSFFKKTAEYMLTELQQIVIPKNYSQIFYDEVRVEDFNFRFTEPYSCDTPFEIKIGNRIYSSFLSDWSTDFNVIRTEIEAFIYALENADINLHFEDSPTILRLQRRILFWNQSGLRVIVIPDSFSHYPPFFCWCKPRQLVRSLYLGLLELFTIETDWQLYDFDTDWDSFRVKSYNHLQSNVIEDYIKGVEEERRLARNRVMLSVKDMLEDYNALKLSLNNISL